MMHGALAYGAVALSVKINNDIWRLELLLIQKRLWFVL